MRAGRLSAATILLVALGQSACVCIGPRGRKADAAPEAVRSTVPVANQPTVETSRPIDPRTRYVTGLGLPAGGATPAATERLESHLLPIEAIPVPPGR